MKHVKLFEGFTEGQKNIQLQEFNAIINDDSMTDAQKYLAVKDLLINNLPNIDTELYRNVADYYTGKDVSGIKNSAATEN